jgi:Cell division protein CrgA
MAKPTSKNSKKTVGRYVDAESRGRVTKRRPAGADHSPHWYGWLILDLLIFGMLVIVLNYLDVLPGATSSWYLALGLVTMFAGFYLATRYR